MKHYKHKLNMLEPGIKMLAAIGISIGMGILFRVFHWMILSNLSFEIGALMALILFVLLLIEQHQDKVMNDEAMKANINNKIL